MNSYIFLREDILLHVVFLLCFKKWLKQDSARDAKSAFKIYKTSLNHDTNVGLIEQAIDWLVFSKVKQALFDW